MSRRILFFLILFFLFSFLLQEVFPYIKTRPLDGVFEKKELPVFHTDSVKNGSYQKNINAWVNENFGFRNTLVRLHNQIGFWLYKRSYTNAVIVGKDNYLLDKTYIDAYTGADYIGTDSLTKLSILIKALQDSLESHSIKLLFVFAPGKASYFSECIPDKYLKDKKSGNYEMLTTLFKKNRINYLDLRKAFDHLKPKSQYPLFPKCGIHWSTYGATIAADSIIKKVSSITTTPLAQMQIEKIDVTDQLKEVDQDVGKSMNLLWDIDNLPMAYPTVKYSNTPKALKILTIGDSYYWTMPVDQLSKHVFKNMSFIYYNKQLYNNNGGEPFNEEQIHRAKLILNQDVIIILSTDANLSKLGWNFFQDTYNKIFNAKTTSGMKIPFEVNLKMQDIYYDKKWLQLITDKAQKLNISIDSMAFIDAKYIVEQEKSLKK